MKATFHKTRAKTDPCIECLIIFFSSTENLAPRSFLHSWWVLIISTSCCNVLTSSGNMLQAILLWRDLFLFSMPNKDRVFLRNVVVNSTENIITSLHYSKSVSNSAWHPFIFKKKIASINKGCSSGEVLFLFCQRETCLPVKQYLIYWCVMINLAAPFPDLQTVIEILQCILIWRIRASLRSQHMRVNTQIPRVSAATVKSMHHITAEFYSTEVSP